MQRGSELWAVAGLLGRFSDQLTALTDAHLGTRWSENSHTVALLTLYQRAPLTTRQLSEASGLNRRAVNRLVNRLVDDRIVATRPDTTDGRAVVVVLTSHGRSRFRGLAQAVGQFFDDSYDIAAEILALLGCDRKLDPSVPLDALSLHREIVTVGARLVAGMTGPAGPNALSGRQRVALLRIATHSEVRPIDLAPILDSGRSAVAYVVDQLCEKGLVTRQHHALARDRRIVLLTLTPSGRDSVREILGAIDRSRADLCRVFALVSNRATVTTNHGSPHVDPQTASSGSTKPGVA